MRVGCYVRVSTQEQAKEGYSIGAQTERLRAYCTARDWTVLEVYTDPAYSGAKMERPAMQRLISDVKNHRLDLVLVYKLDRLSRSQKDTLYLIEDVFMKNGVSFVSINENFDTSTAFGRAMVGILSVFAQLEREQIKERSQMGRVERAKAGLWKGGGVSPVGYDYMEAESKLRINDYEAMQVREIFDLYVNQRKSISAIQQHMINSGYTYKSGSWRYRSTVRGVLKNPVYTGVIQWHGESYPGQHPPLVSKELFSKAQARLREAGPQSGKSPEYSPFKATQLLTGILFCKLCGARYFGSGGYRGPHNLPNSQKKLVHIYACYSRAKTRRDMIKDPNCKNKRWRAEQLDELILQLIYKLSFDQSYCGEPASAAPSVPEKQGILLRHIAELDSQTAKMLDLYQYQQIPASQIAERLETLAKEKSTLQAALNDLGTEPPIPYDEQARAVAATAQEVLKNATQDEKRAFVHALIQRIDIDHDDIFITWRFC